METGRIKRRKRRRWLGYVAFLAVVLSSAAVLCLAMFFRTQEIVVVGNQRYTAEELISASGIQLEQNIFAVDRARTAAQIKGVFSYLEEVEVVPVLPTTMEIRVVESVPAVAVVNSPESYSLVSTGGRIIEQCAGMSEDGLPLVLGTNFAWYEQGAYPLELPEEVTDESRKDHREATDQELEGVRVMKTLGYVLESIETVGLDKVDYIDVSDGLSTEILWDQRALIKLGTELELTRKLEFAKAILEQELEEDFTGIVDVSVMPKVSKTYTREEPVEEFMDSFYLENYYKY